MNKAMVGILLLVCSSVSVAENQIPQGVEGSQGPGAERTLQKLNTDKNSGPSQAQLQCYMALNSDPNLVRLIPKVGAIQPTVGFSPSIEILANKTKASKEDKLAINHWGKARQECDQKMQTYFQARMSTENFVRLQNTYKCH